jgi:hypothetical protein
MLNLALQVLCFLVVGVPASLVLAELFWFGGRCSRGGPHAWAQHPAPYLSASWVKCSKCGEEDY